MQEKPSILIVDDEENLRLSLAIILRRVGYDVMGAGTIKEARQRLEAAAYQLTFLDLKLPDESGLTFLPELRSRFPDMPVVILTAHDKLDAAIEAVRKGARDFLLKPVDPPLIIERVAEILSERQEPGSIGDRYAHLKSLLKKLQPEPKPPPAPPSKPSN